MKTLIYLFLVSAFFSSSVAFGQTDTRDTLKHLEQRDNPGSLNKNAVAQMDIIDVVQKILYKKPPVEKRKLPRKANFSIIPYAGYSLSTGFTADVSGNVAFFTSKSHQENLSVILADIGYDSKSQKIFLTRSELWTHDNDYKVVSDQRWEHYPTDTFGLGILNNGAKDDEIIYNYVRIFETVLKKIAPGYYAGIGYNLDYHYAINEAGNVDNTVSDFKRYGGLSRSLSSGVSLDFLFDNRKNSINPFNGAYANVVYRSNLTFLGSDANWQSLQFDLRKYFKPNANSNNILAFWSIIQFTSGNVPYLDLPATGADMYNNSGRGYALGRFRGKNMLYLESEYRFGLTKNGLLGAVLFANGESFSEYQSNAFKKIAPAAGTGIRIKLNKHSNTNICIDYAWGIYGSHGFFANLGEVF